MHDLLQAGGICIFSRQANRRRYFRTIHMYNFVRTKKAGRACWCRPILFFGRNWTKVSTSQPRTKTNYCVLTGQRYPVRVYSSGSLLHSIGTQRLVVCDTPGEFSLACMHPFSRLLCDSIDGRMLFSSLVISILISRRFHFFSFRNSFFIFISCLSFFNRAQSIKVAVSLYATSILLSYRGNSSASFCPRCDRIHPVYGLSPKLTYRIQIL